MLKDKLALWHRIVREKDWQALDQLLDDQVQFHSPFVWKPKQGKPVTIFILSNVIDVLQGFQYHREWIDDNSLALEFSAEAGGLQVKGIDLIRFNEQGKIIDFEVMIRPGNGLMEVGQQMTQRMEQAGVALK